MDLTVAALAALATQLLGGAVGEAGKSAWTALTELVGRRSERQRVAEAVQDAAERPESNGRALVLAELLDEAAAADPGFADQLREWFEESQRVVDGGGTGNVRNEVSGQVSGSVVQARDITGGINFGDQAGQ